MTITIKHDDGEINTIETTHAVMVFKNDAKGIHTMAHLGISGGPVSFLKMITSCTKAVEEVIDRFMTLCSSTQIPKALAAQLVKAAIDATDSMTGEASSRDAFKAPDKDVLFPDLANLFKNGRYPK